MAGMTTREWAPWSDDIYMYMRTLFVPGDIRDVRKWTSYVQALESYRMTDRQTDKLRVITSRHVTKSHHSIRHIKRHMLHATLLALSFLKPELWATEVYIVGIGIFYLFCSCDLDLDPMTFICELDLYYREIHWMYKYELRTSRLSQVIVWQKYRYIHTDRHYYYYYYFYFFY